MRHDSSSPYRRSLIGRIILVALLLQWSLLWLRSLSHSEYIRWQTPSGTALAVSFRPGALIGGYVRAEESFETPMFRSVLADSAVAIHREESIRTDGFWRYDNPFCKLRIYRSGDGTNGSYFLLVPYWALMTLTVLVYLSAGQFRRYFAKRRARRALPSGTSPE